MPFQPRSGRDPAYCRSLGESMKAIGQKVPIIGYSEPNGLFAVTDGGCRVEGAKLCSIGELLALDLGHEPTRIELLLAQAAIDNHKKHFSPMDRARLWNSIKEERGCTNRELAKELGVSDSLVGDCLDLLTLPPDVQEQVNSGALDASKGSLIAQMESDPHRQRELAAAGTGMSRAKLLARIRQKGRDTRQDPLDRVNSIRCPLPSGITVVVKGNGISLDDASQALAELIKAMKKASQEGLDSKTFQAVLKDKSKAGG